MLKTSLLLIVISLFFGLAAFTEDTLPATKATPIGHSSKAEAIRSVIRTNLTKINRCYGQALTVEPGIEGKLVFVWDVDDKGEVIKSAVDPIRSTIQSANLNACIGRELNALKFPPGAKGETTTVEYPFEFHRK